MDTGYEYVRVKTLACKSFCVIFFCGKSICVQTGVWIESRVEKRFTLDLSLPLGLADPSFSFWIHTEVESVNVERRN